MAEATEKAAIALVTRAVTLDKEGRFTEAFTCYTEGTQLLMEAIKGNKNIKINSVHNYLHVKFL
jgi:MIT (microtubule interacting and transport) domain